MPVAQEGRDPHDLLWGKTDAHLALMGVVAEQVRGAGVALDQCFDVFWHLVSLLHVRELPTVLNYAPVADGDHHVYQEAAEPALLQAEHDLVPQVDLVGLQEGTQQFGLPPRLQDRGGHAAPASVPLPRPLLAFIDADAAGHALAFHDDEPGAVEHQVVDLSHLAFMLQTQIVEHVDVGVTAEGAFEVVRHLQFSVITRFLETVTGGGWVVFLDDHDAVFSLYSV